MRLPIAAGLLTAVCIALLSADGSDQQPDAKKAQQKYDPPKATKPDEATLKTIAEKTEKLRKAVEGLRAKKIALDVLIEVEIYLKAAENIVRFEEWYSPNSGKWALQTLDQGVERAKEAEGGETPWRNSSGKWVVRAYQSRIDQSIQPFAVLLPQDYGKDPKKKWRLDIVLHGRDSALTEAKFIASHPPTAKAPKDLDYVQIEVYGRGNNAYRWAGEQDVIEAAFGFVEGDGAAKGSAGWKQVVLRGFSMGGAGTWHLGLHHPTLFKVIGPGAGFTTTHGYVGGLPKQLPDYQEKCLHIYDAVDYAENAFNVPVVAYSGSRDPQKAAADNIENALKGFKEPLRFTHLVAPGLEHQMPKEWQEKAEAEYKKALSGGRPIPDRVRFVTYTTRYNDFGHGLILELEKLYEKAVVDSQWSKEKVTIKTQNVSALAFRGNIYPETVITVDGQLIPIGHDILAKTNGKWSGTTLEALMDTPRKRATGRRFLQGPIDDAFTGPFRVVDPSRAGWNPSVDRYLSAAREQFAREWDKYFRGKLPIYEDRSPPFLPEFNLVLFGDPQSNPFIASALPHLPIKWTKDKLVVNGVEYDAKTHLPVLIYPLSKSQYIVLNSGHTFHEADFKGTNALLYPRLGDWAVIKPTPTAKDPAVCEVVAAGLFDENWQFQKK